MSIRDAVDAELELLPKAVQESVAAELARAIADDIDNGFVPGRQGNPLSLSRELRACMAELKAGTSESERAGDPVDELATQRERRRATAQGL